MALPDLDSVAASRPDFSNTQTTRFGGFFLHFFQSRLEAETSYFFLEGNDNLSPTQIRLCISGDG